MKWLIALGVFVLVFMFVLPLRHLLQFREKSQTPLRFSVSHELMDESFSISVASLETEHPLIVRFVEIPISLQEQMEVGFPSGFVEMDLRENPGETNRSLNQEYHLGLDETLVVRLQGDREIAPGRVAKFTFPIKSLVPGFQPAWIKLEVYRVLKKFGYSQAVSVKVDIFDVEQKRI